MVKQSKAEKAIWEIYRRCYRECDPPADFDQLMEAGETKHPGWFDKYYLPAERLTEIYNEVSKEYKLSKWEKRSIAMEVYLGGTPSSKKK